MPPQSILRKSVWEYLCLCCHQILTAPWPWSLCLVAQIFHCVWWQRAGDSMPNQINLWCKKLWGFFFSAGQSGLVWFAFTPFYFLWSESVNKVLKWTKIQLHFTHCLNKVRKKETFIHCCVWGGSNIVDPELLSNWSEVPCEQTRAGKTPTTSNFTMQRRLRGLILVLVTVHSPLLSVFLMLVCCCCCDRNASSFHNSRSCLRDLV